MPRKATATGDRKGKRRRVATVRRTETGRRCVTRGTHGDACSVETMLRDRVIRVVPHDACHRTPARMGSASDTIRFGLQHALKATVSSAMSVAGAVREWVVC